MQTRRYAGEKSTELEVVAGSGERRLCPQPREWGGQRNVVLGGAGDRLCHGTALVTAGTGQRDSSRALLAEPQQMLGWVAEPGSCQKQQLMGTGFCPCSRLLPQGCFFSPGDARGRDGSVPGQEQIVPQRGRSGEEAFLETSLQPRLFWEGFVAPSDCTSLPNSFCSLPLKKGELHAGARPASLFPLSGTLLY